MIVIEPVGGLANRMRVIASALKMQKELKCKLICIWNENFELNAPFHMLFESINGLEINSKLHKYNRLKSSCQKNIIKKIIVKLTNKLLGIDYCIKQQDFKKSMWGKKIDINKLCTCYKNIYIQTCEEFGDNYLEFQKFKPVKELMEQIRKTEKQFNHTIGIHIRRTDNIHSIEKSPVNLFEGKILEKINHINDVTFFLSTDDQSTEKEFVEKFGNRLIIRDRILNRNSIAGIQDAVIDMYCLSRTKIIYGSYWSSFSDISARIGKIEFIPLKKV